MNVLRAILGAGALMTLVFAFGCGEGARDLTLNDVRVLLEAGNAAGEMSLRAHGSPLSYNMTHSLGPTIAVEFDGSIDFSKVKTGDDE